MGKTPQKSLKNNLVVVLMLVLVVLDVVLVVLKDFS